MENDNVTSTQGELASPVNRFLAAFIDGLVGYIPLIVFGLVSDSLIMVGYLITIAYMFVKDTIPALNGQSIGKKAMKIKVIKQDTGESIMGDYAAGIIRAVSLMIPIFGIVDALMVFTDDRLRFGDKWAKTKVVKE